MGHNQRKDMDMTRIPGKEKEKGKNVYLSNSG